MPPTIFWIDRSLPGRLAIMPRPRGGDWLADELKQFRFAGIDVVVSLLTEEETEELDLVHESDACAAAGIRYFSFPIADRRLPIDDVAFAAFLSKLNAELAHGKGVAIHCRAGIGRAAIVAACLLCGNGMPSNEALKLISDARGCAVPDTDEQKGWIMQFTRNMQSDVL